MASRIWSNVAPLVAVMLAHGALAQDKQLDLTPAGKAILQGKIALDSHLLNDRLGRPKPVTFPLAMCTFPGGLCGAVRRDGTVAVPPRYDWVGTFSDNRAAVRARRSLRLRRRGRARGRQAAVSHCRRLQVRLRAGRRGRQIRLDRSRRQDDLRAEVRVYRRHRVRTASACPSSGGLAD